MTFLAVLQVLLEEGHSPLYLTTWYKMKNTDLLAPEEWDCPELRSADNVLLASAKSGWDVWTKHGVNPYSPAATPLSPNSVELVDDLIFALENCAWAEAERLGDLRPAWMMKS